MTGYSGGGPIPARHRFHLAAEWAPQHSVLLCWPHQDTDWRPWLDELERFYLDLAALLLHHQRLLILCRDDPHRRHIRERLGARGLPLQQITLIPLPYDDTWVRDYGPLSLLDQQGKALLKDFRFNGWGGRYPAEQDDRVSRRLADRGLFRGTPFQSIDFTLEGGALETDGAGTLLATRRSLIDERRNPGMGKERVEALLSRELGIERFLWLQHGALTGDDTDGHIDTLVRFADPETLLHVTALPDDPDRPGLQRMARELRGFRTAQGRPYRLVPLPAPAPVQDPDGRRLPASYANFLITGGAVLAPVYGDPADEPLCRCLESCFPGREIVPVDCRPLIRQNGSLHCATLPLHGGDRGAG